MKLFTFSLVLALAFSSPQLISAVETSISALDLSDIEPENGQADIEIYDPLEQFNRIVFNFNNNVDYLLLEPAATVYHDAIPLWGRDRVSNFLSNLQEPINCINGVIQLDANIVATSIGRFLTNTLLGVGGLFDIASTQPDLKPYKTDFGLTLRKYSAEPGIYVVVPILGPSTTRDAAGRIFDLAFDPLNYSWAKNKYRNAKFIANIVESREKLIEPLQTIRETSLDEYSAIRSIYWQKRK